MLKKKQTNNPSDWGMALKNIESAIPKTHLDRLIDKTLAAIQKMIQGKNAAYCWSGGKDSLVIQGLCELSGIRDCMIAVTNLEYPEFEAWVRTHKPGNLEIINTGQDLDWLVKNRNMIFPQDNAIAAKWFRIVQHRAQNMHFKERNRDVLILGRRKADGNYVGRDGIYHAKGVVRYSPIAAWTHEEVLAYIHYYHIKLPPIYSWKNGYLCGTHPWPARQWTGSIQNGWKEVFDIDKSIVIEAAKRIKSANAFLENLGGRYANQKRA